MKTAQTRHPTKSWFVRWTFSIAAVTLIAGCTSTGEKVAKKSSVGGVQDLGHMVSCKLISTVRKTVLWERRQLFLSGIERKLSDYQNNPAILVNDLQSSSDRYCGLIANQLVY